MWFRLAKDEADRKGPCDSCFSMETIYWTKIAFSVAPGAVLSFVPHF